MLTDRDIACHYHCYRNKAATARVLEQFRQVYLTATIHLISDGGDDFSDLAEQHQCRYHHQERNIGLQIKTTAERMDEWMYRFRYVCAKSTEPWILILEDDVEVRHAIADPQSPMTGNHAPGKAFEGPLGAYIFGRQPHLKNLGYGGGGGTLVSRTVAAAAIESYHKNENFDDWNQMVGGWNASDLWLTAAVMLQGHQYTPNPDLAETKRHRKWAKSGCSIIHHQGGWK